MKVFWGLIAILLVAATAVAFMQREGSTSRMMASGVSDREPSPSVTSASPFAGAGDVEQEPVASETPTTIPDGLSDDADSGTSNPATVSQGDEATAQPPIATDDTVNIDDDATDNVTTALLSAGTDDEESGDDDGLDMASEEANAIATEPDAAAGPDMLNATVEELEDGSLLIAGKYTIRGTGDMSDPYVVPWDLLVSISSAYRPREGLKELPDFIMRLHDKQVKITGYVAFPMVAGEIEELLVMLNQWDGCCVGVPPTVYDSVEVRLVEPIITTGASTTMPYGTVMGRMTIDPYFVNEWLVGLYLMEEAEIEMDF